MAQAYIGEIRCFGFNFAPVSWAQCNGQLLDISNNTALFTVIGTTYGGDGTTTFALPNLRGQVPMHWGNGSGGFNTVIGQVQGVSTVTLTTSQIPAHTHTITVGVPPSGGVVDRTGTPSSTTYISDATPDQVYNTSPSGITAAFSSVALSIQGSSQPHDNMQPYLVVNFCIALFGVFPSQN
jgi:microcystin-dependent protein